LRFLTLESRFHDRATEIREVLFKPCNKNLLDLLQSGRELWLKLDKLLQINRDIMDDERWIAELKAAIKSTLGEAVYERTRRCLGIDSEDSWKVEEEDTGTYVTVESVFEGEPFIENYRAREDMKRASSPNPGSSPLPFSLDDVGTSPIRHHRAGSSTSLRGKPVRFLEFSS
jgi:hypothetical protein